MEAVIKLSPSELDSTLLSKIKALVGDSTDFELTISISKKKSNYLQELDESINQLNDPGQTVTFTFEEFMAYPSK